MTTEPRENPIEDQILRSLDGALDDDALLELRRAVLRDPKARRLMEAHEQIDALSGEVIRAAVDDERLSFDPLALTRSTPAPPIRRNHWSWWLIPGTIAAAIAVVLMIPHVTPPGMSNGGLAGGDTGRISAPIPVIGSDGGGAPARPMDYGGVVPASDRPKRVQRQTLREYTGVIGADGRLYLIEVDRTRTLRRAGGREVRPASNDGL